MKGGSCSVPPCLVMVPLIVLVSRLQMMMCGCCVVSSRCEMMFSGRVLRGRRHDPKLFSRRYDGIFATDD